MKVVLAGSGVSAQTLKRLLISVREIAVLDRPSVVLKSWGTVGHPHPLRQFYEFQPEAGSPVSIWTPPGYELRDIYEAWMTHDLQSPRFRQSFLRGLAASDEFAGRFIPPAANYGMGGTGASLRAALVADERLLLPEEDAAESQGFPERASTHQERREHLRMLLCTASIDVTAAFLLFAQHGYVPITDDEHYSALLAERFAAGGAPPDVCGATALQVALTRAVVPDSVVQEKSVPELLAYRVRAAEQFDAWSTEAARVAATLAILPLNDAEATRAAVKHLDAHVRPQLGEFERRLEGAARDLLASVAWNNAKFSVPAVFASNLVNFGPLGTAAAVLAAIAPQVPPFLDYWSKRDTIARANPYTFLIGVAPRRHF